MEGESEEPLRTLLWDFFERDDVGDSLLFQSTEA